MEAPRYTAKEIEDGLYSGMDPDVELVAARYYDALAAENTELRRRLDKICEYAKHNKRNRRFITIAEGRTG